MLQSDVSRGDHGCGSKELSARGSGRCGHGALVRIILSSSAGAASLVRMAVDVGASFSAKRRVDAMGGALVSSCLGLPQAITLPACITACWLALCHPRPLGFSIPIPPTASPAASDWDERFKGLSVPFSLCCLLLLSRYFICILYCIP